MCFGLLTLLICAHPSLTTPAFVPADKGWAHRCAPFSPLAGLMGLRLRSDRLTPYGESTLGIRRVGVALQARPLIIPGFFTSFVLVQRLAYVLYVFVADSVYLHLGYFLHLHPSPITIPVGPSHWHPLMGSGNCKHGPFTYLQSIPVSQNHTHRDPLAGTHLMGNSVHGPTTYLRDLTMRTLSIHPMPKTYTYRDPLTGTHLMGNSVHGPLLI